MTDPQDRTLIEASLELAAERAGDLTALVYDRLFAEQPATKVLFWRDQTGKIKGEMLARVFEAIFDFIGERRYADHLIQTSAAVHTEYDVSPAVFRSFFGVVAATVRDVLGTDWTPATGSAWQRLVADLDSYARAANLPS